MASGTDPKNPSSDVIKDAVPDQPAPEKSGGGALLEQKRLTIGQHLFIWVLIILVGVVFGIGSSFQFLRPSSPDMLPGISQDDVNRLQSINQRLDDLLLQGRTQFNESPQRVAQFLALARIAESEGLTPDEREQDRLLKTFLGQNIGGPYGQSVTIGQILAGAESGPRGIKHDEMVLWLAKRQAVQALYASRVHTPAVSASVGNLVARLGRERAPGETISACAAVLSAAQAAVVIADDDAQIQTTYDSVKETRFRTLPAVIIAVASADLASLSATAVASIPRTAIEARYLAERDERWTLPGPSATPAYRPLSEVEPVIRYALATEQARITARQQVNAFAESVESLGLLKADESAFLAAAAKAGLRTATGAQVQEPIQGEVTIPGIGSFKDEARMWDQQPGEISLTLESQGAEGTVFVVRTAARLPGGLRPLSEVRDQVKALVAARRGWADMRKAVDAIAQAAGSSGAGGLAKVLASPEHARWNTTPVTVTLRPNERLMKPGNDADSPATEWTHAAALSMPGAPVLLQRLDSLDGEPPRIRLLQFAASVSLNATAAAAAEAQTDTYRELLQNYRYQLVSAELDGRR